MIISVSHRLLQKIYVYTHTTGAAMAKEEEDGNAR
jgi:hypothetical protein